LIHIEIQSHYDVKFEKRMYTYNYRATDLYDKFVVSLAILGDTNPTWRPNSYDKAMLGCELRLKFPTVKLIDYEPLWNELESNNNPFAIITMAHLRTKTTTNKFTEREEWKWKLIRGLYERGLTKEDVVKLFKIIDKMMTLPKPLQSALVAKINRFEEERKMPLISPTEELAMERGKQELIIRQLNRRVGQIQASLIKQVQSLDVEQLELLGEALLDFYALTDLEQWLLNRPKPLEL